MIYIMLLKTPFMKKFLEKVIRCFGVKNDIEFRNIFTYLRSNKYFLFNLGINIHIYNTYVNIPVYFK